MFSYALRTNILTDITPIRFYLNLDQLNLYTHDYRCDDSLSNIYQRCLKKWLYNS